MAGPSQKRPGSTSCRGCYSAWRHVRSEALAMALTMLVITSKSYHPRIIPRSSRRPDPRNSQPSPWLLRICQTGVNPARVLSWGGRIMPCAKKRSGKRKKE